MGLSNCHSSDSASCDRTSAGRIAFVGRAVADGPPLCCCCSSIDSTLCSALNGSTGGSCFASATDDGSSIAAA